MREPPGPTLALEKVRVHRLERPVAFGLEIHHVVDGPDGTGGDDEAHDAVAADLIALAGEVEVLRLGDAAERVGEPHEHAGADEAAGGRGEVGALVAAVGGLDEVLGDTDAGVEEAVADGEAVIAGELGDALGDPGEQRFHADGDHRRCSRAGGSAPGPPAPCVPAVITRHRRGFLLDQGFKDQVSSGASRNAIIVSIFYGVLAHRAPTKL
ncbi:hypothetical protein WMF41_36145 [Sorangium sp. So ce1151]